MALAVAAVLLMVIGGLLWVRSRSFIETTTVTLDLRERSVARGENPAQSGQPPLELSRRAKHLVLELPIGSKEGAYEVALLSQSGAELFHTSATAGLGDHIVVLRADVDFGGLSPGSYFLGLRQPGLEWTRFPIQVL
jgi:hypothetical protein